MYCDTSVLLSRLLNQSNQLANWAEWEEGYTSELTRVEFLRTVDRLRLGGALTDDERVELQEQFEAAFACLNRAAVTDDLLERASSPLHTVLGTLDAVHLVTALELAESRQTEIVLLTHDRQLATCARAMRMKVEGV